MEEKESWVCVGVHARVWVCAGGHVHNVTVGRERKGGWGR